MYWSPLGSAVLLNELFFPKAHPHDRLMREAFLYNRNLCKNDDFSQRNTRCPKITLRYKRKLGKKMQYFMKTIL
jgi:hypothetical protein